MALTPTTHFNLELIAAESRDKLLNRRPFPGGQIVVGLPTQSSGTHLFGLGCNSASPSAHFFLVSRERH
jgi:hypothetical protein